MTEPGTVTTDANEQRMARALQAIDRLQARLATVEGAAREAIAIVGIGCRFPGGADDADAFWRLLDEGRDAISVVPADRWNADAYFDADADAAGRIVTREGGFIGAPDGFDAAFFGISPKEAASLDPQQRLLLEVAWEAMEHAGLPPPSLAGRPVGVFVGISSNDYSQMLLSRPEEAIDAYLATGNAHSVAAGRLSYTFGFTGPSLIVDTACSSSLVAVHLACQSLRAGETEVALAGGVNRVLTPDGSITFSRAHMLAPDGRCKAFDAAADGFSRGEGCGVIVLKRLSDAQRDGDAVLAVIRGSAVNQDGRSGGLTVPNGPAQQTVIRNALRQAGVAPADIDYVEAHGTGTALGDPIEVGALAGVFGGAAGGTRERPLQVGSVKTNVGHLEAAAGICGLIKVALALRHDRLPAHLHFRTPSPHIDWASAAVEVTAQPRAWAGGDTRFAGVSSFGFGGTNAHIVLQGAPVTTAPALPEDGADVLLLSARDEAALLDLARRYQPLLQAPAAHWRALCRAAATTRASFAQRLAVPAAGMAEAAIALDAFVAGQASNVLTAPSGSTPRVAFLFTGQGAQYAGMGRELYAAEPVFRGVIDGCSALLEREEGWSLTDVLYGAGGASLAQTQYAQPALFALAHALAETWRARGVRPQAVLGHSIGEFAAAVTAGVFDMETALRLVAARGRLMQALPPGGAMMAVLTSAETLAAQLPAGVVIAAYNAPDACVLSGDAVALDAFAPRLQAQGVQATRLDVSHAFHSPRMAPMLDAFGTVAAGQRYAAATLPFHSTVEGRRIAVTAFDAAYWVRHIERPVQFRSAFDALLADGYDCVIEIGPQAHLLGLAARWPQPASPLALPSMRRAQDACATMADSLGRLFVRGAKLAAPAGTPIGAARPTLPTYPFQRQRHWADFDAVRGAARAAGTPAHPLLGTRLRLAGAGAQRHEARIDAAATGWAQDHDVFGHIVLPAAGFVEIALAAARAGGSAAPRLAAIEFRQALRLDAPRIVQVVLEPQAGGARFEVFALDGEDWVTHAAGRIADDAVPPAPLATLQAARATCQQTVDVEACYRRLQAQGVGYGPTFRALASVAVGEACVLSRLQLPHGVPVGQTVLHPVLLDACLQGIAALFVDDESHPTYLPAMMDAVQVASATSPRQAWCHLVARRGPDLLSIDLDLLGDDGSLLACVRGLQLRPASVARVSGRSAEDSGPFVVDWPEAALPAALALPAPQAFAQASRAVFDEEFARPDCQGYLQLLPELERLAQDLARQVLAELDAAHTGADDIVPALRPLYDRLHELAALAGSGAGEGPAALAARRAALLARFPQARAELALLGRATGGMAEVLRGRAEPLALLFPDGDASDLTALYESSPGARLMNALARDTLAQALAAIGHPARLLEIGAGTGGTTAHLLPLLAADAGHTYLYTDIAPALLARARERFGPHGALRFERLDIEASPQAQGFVTGDADVVIAANVLHATADLQRTLQHAASLLAPGGLLLLLEVTQPLGWLDLIFGLTDGWWRFSDRTLRERHPLLSAPSWQALLERSGFDAAQPLVPAGAGLPQNVIVARRADAAPALALFADVHDAAADALQAAWAGACTRHPLPATREAALAAGHAQQVLLMTGAEAVCTPDALERDIGALRGLVQALAAPASGRRPALALVTRGAAAADGDAGSPLQAALSGVARVAALEHPELQVRRIDVDAAADAESQAQTIVDEMRRGAAEHTVAWRQGHRHVARLGRLPADADEHGPFELALARRGSPDDLMLRPLVRRAPAPHEVEIRVQAAGLNLIDVLDVLDVLPFERDWLGVECAGEVVAVGEGVRGLSVGDAVIALAPGGFRQYVTVDADWVACRPATLAAQDAATIPACFLTARHALIEVAGLRAGERVLIHAAAGGTGMASVAVAHEIGAEVFGSASPSKWPALREGGVARALHSRTLDFSREVQAAGGVDVVLNSLSGDFIPASMACLKPGGRFIEIGKRGIWSAEQVRALRPDVQYHIVDLMDLARREPPRIRALLGELVARFGDGRLRPLPRRSFALAHAADAFRCMQRAAHTGKLVIDFELRAPAPRADAGYLITGAFGGLGLLTAQWLVAQGARHLLLIGRRAPDAAALATLDVLRAAGAELHLRQIDVSDGEALDALFACDVAALPPLRGIFHAAGVLDDGVLTQLDAARMHAVLAPKLHGAWHLHRLGQELSLDYFMLYSSAASLFGSPGQASHVAANSYLDALAHHRRARGLAAQSINWGPWSDIGSAASAQTHAVMQARGIGGIAPADGMRAFAALAARRQVVQAGVVPLRWPEFGAHGARDDVFFSAFAARMNEGAARRAPAAGDEAASDAAAASAQAEWSRIAGIAPRQRRAEVVRLLQGEVAAVLGLPQGQRPDPATGFFDMGMDSLMAVELRNRLARRSGVTLSSAGIFEFPTIHALSGHLLDSLLPDDAAQPDTMPAEAATEAAASAQPVSAEDIDPAIAAELAALDSLLKS